MIGFAVTGSFCTHKKAIKCLETLVFHGYDVIPIASEKRVQRDAKHKGVQRIIRSIRIIRVQLLKREQHSAFEYYPFHPKAIVAESVSSSFQSSHPYYLCSEKPRISSL